MNRVSRDPLLPRNASLNRGRTRKLIRLALLFCGAAGLQAADLKFEAEDWTEPRNAWLVNRSDDNHWNLWGTDHDAQAKWSGGVVLQSPEVKADRARPEDGAPPLHTRITGLPAGTFDVAMNSTRTLAISRDGVTWTPSRGGMIAEGVVIKDGTFEFWVDDRYTNEGGPPGSAYYDYLLFQPDVMPEPKPKIEGFAKTRVVEKLDRGLVAVTGPNGVHVSWRMLPGDAADLGFNVYRQAGQGQPVKVNSEPIRITSDCVDPAAPADGELIYTVCPVLEGKDGPVQGSATCQTSNYAGIKLEGDSGFNKCGLGDLDGDGKLDYVIKQPAASIDPAASYWKKSPDTYKLEAWTHNGKLLWRKDLGWAIEQGVWYSPFLVFDFDGDGRAEVAVKTGEGDPRDPDGRVSSGPEWVSILDGRTGRERCRAPWPSRDGFGTLPSSSYNYASRNQLAVAYLDGRTPCLIVLRGTYNTMKAEAWQLVGQKLEPLWTYDSRGLKRKLQGQGAHFTQAVDLDGDGRDEVVLGSVVLDDNGVPLWTTGLGHPDHVYIGDHNPARPGLEIYYGIESRQMKNTMCQVDAQTGKILWGWDKPTTHVHATGLCSDIDPLHPGAESYSADCINHIPNGDRWLWSSTGEVLRRDLDWSFGRNCVWWDADLQREVVQGSTLFKYGGKRAAGQIEGSIVLIADVLGDWREELICSLPGELRIYTTSIPAMDRRTTLLADPLYRQDAAMCSQGYTQVPTLTYSLEAKAPNLNLTLLDVLEGPNVRLVVSAPLDRGVNGKLALTAEGGTITPAEQSVDVKSGGRVVIEATARAAEDGTGEVNLSATLTFGDTVLKTTAMLTDGLIDGGFERSSAGKPAGWGLFSREQKGVVQSVRDVVHGGRAAAYLTHDGEQDWALSNGEKLAVKPGWKLRVRGWAKSEGSGSTELAIVALKDGKTVTWSIGGAKAKGGFDWRLLQGETTVPEGVDQVFVRWVGSGQARLHVDDTALAVVRK